MLKKPVWAVVFGVLAAAAFVGAGQLLGFMPFIDTPWGGPLAELCLGLLAAVVLLVIGKGRVLTERGAGFKEGLKAGGFMAGYLTLLVLSMAAIWEQEPVGELEVLRFAAYMLAISLAEELTFRGVIQNVLAGAFGRDSERGVWLTVLASGAIFGSVHISNVLAGAALAGVVMQALAAAAIGMYFGAIYIRCGNIWFLVLLHAFNDLAGLMAVGGMDETAMVESVSSYGPERLITVALYLGLTMFLLRPKKMAEIIRPKNIPLISRGVVRQYDR